MSGQSKSTALPGPQRLDTGQLHAPQRITGTEVEGLDHRGSGNEADAEGEKLRSGVRIKSW